MARDGGSGGDDAMRCDAMMTLCEVLEGRNCHTAMRCGGGSGGAVREVRVPSSSPRPSTVPPLLHLLLHLHPPLVSPFTSPHSPSWFLPSSSSSYPPTNPHLHRSPPPRPKPSPPPPPKPSSTPTTPPWTPVGATYPPSITPLQA